MGNATTAERQVRIAWLTLTIAFVLFAGMVVGGAAAARWVIQNATAPETATLSLAPGNEVRVRHPGEADWRLARDGSTVREGDVIATSAASVALLSFFDGSTVEMMDDTTIQIGRIRSSRFLKRTRLIEVTPERGLVYATLRSSDEYAYVELKLRTEDAVVTASDDLGAMNSQQVLVEVLGDEPARSGGSSIRVAALRGAVQVKLDVPGGSLVLSEGHQTIVQSDGEIGTASTPQREIVVDGNFSDRLEAWQVIPEVQAGTGMDRVTVVDAGSDAPADRAVVLHPAPAGDASEAVGIRQQNRRLLRDSGRFTLGLDVMMEQIHLPVTTDQPPSVTITVAYEDANGGLHEWTRAVALEESEWPERHSGGDQAEGTARIDSGEWRRVMFDLAQSEPSVRQITSIVVYASGKDYQTSVTNISLTVQEIAE